MAMQDSQSVATDETSTRISSDTVEEITAATIGRGHSGLAHD